MNRLEFINDLGQRLSSLPREETQRILNYYVEAIDDRVEDGMTEEAAIAAFGDLDALAASILADQGRLSPPKAPEPEVIDTPVVPEKRPVRWWMVVLLVLGSPIWLSLGVAAGAIVLSLWVVCWSLVISLWAADVSLILGGIAGAAGVWLLPVTPDTLAVRLLVCGCSAVVAGLGLMLLPCMVKLTVWFAGLHGRFFRFAGQRRRRRMEVRS